MAIEEVVEDTPAAEAGLEAATGTKTVDGVEVPTGGDVVVEFDGKEVTTSAELQSAVDSKRPGDKVTITVLRDGEAREIEVTLDTRPERVQ